MSVPCIGSTCFPNGELTANIATLAILIIPLPCGECYSNRRIIPDPGPAPAPNGEDLDEP